MSTVNSAAGQARLAEPIGPYHQLQNLREENSRLLAQVMEMQRNYQEVLRQSMNEQRLSLQALAETFSQASLRENFSQASLRTPDDSTPT